VQLDADDNVSRCSIGLFGLGSTPERAQAAEEAALGANTADIDADDIGRTAMSQLQSIPADLHGSADYHRRVGAVMVSRAWQQAAQEAARD
jgi:carbon-monoxide dehydrogenase medium subunit